MKIEYKFVDGTVTEIEVDGSLGEFMLEMKNEGDRVERKETRRHVLLSAVDPEDRYFDSGRDTPEEIARKDELERLADAVADSNVAEAEMTVTKEPEKAGRSGKAAAKNTAKKDAKAAKQEPEEKPLTLEEVRAVLAEKSRSGHTEEVRASYYLQHRKSLK
jgi:hypothetical protein